MSPKSAYRSIKGRDLRVGMTLRGGNVTYRVVGIAGETVSVRRIIGSDVTTFRLDPRQSYRVWHASAAPGAPLTPYVDVPDYRAALAEISRALHEDAYQGEAIAACERIADVLRSVGMHD